MFSGVDVVSGGGAFLLIATFEYLGRGKGGRGKGDAGVPG